MTHVLSTYGDWYKSQKTSRSLLTTFSRLLEPLFRKTHTWTSKQQEQLGFLLMNTCTYGPEERRLKPPIQWLVHKLLFLLSCSRPHSSITMCINPLLNDKAGGLKRFYIISRNEWARALTLCCVGLFIAAAFFHSDLLYNQIINTTGHQHQHTCINIFSTSIIVSSAVNWLHIMEARSSSHCVNVHAHSIKVLVSNCTCGIRALCLIVVGYASLLSGAWKQTQNNSFPKWDVLPLKKKKGGCDCVVLMLYAKLLSKHQSTMVCVLQHINNPLKQHAQYSLQDVRLLYNN